MDLYTMSQLFSICIMHYAQYLEYCHYFFFHTFFLSSARSPTLTHYKCIAHSVRMHDDDAVFITSKVLLFRQPKKLVHNNDQIMYSNTTNIIGFCPHSIQSQFIIEFIQARLWFHCTQSNRKFDFIQYSKWNGHTQTYKTISEEKKKLNQYRK